MDRSAGPDLTTMLQAGPAPPAAEGLAFGRFSLIPDRRLLLRDGDRVPIGARGFDILLLLIQRRDRFNTRDEIRAEVWRGLNVADNNVSVQMSRLRRLLGDPDAEDAPIVSVPGQGYRFVAPLLPAPPGPDAVPLPVQAPAEAAEPVAPGRLRARLLVLATLPAFCLGLWLAPARHGPGNAENRGPQKVATLHAPPAAMLLAARTGPEQDDEDPNR